jgi:hypothetical protein
MVLAVEPVSPPLRFVLGAASILWLVWILAGFGIFVVVAVILAACFLRIGAGIQSAEPVLVVTAVFLLMAILLHATLPNCPPPPGAPRGWGGCG